MKTEVKSPDANLSVEVPAKWIVCPDCNGSGTELNHHLKGVWFSAEDMNEDPDFAEDYFGGTYDVPCSRCCGRTTIAVPDVSLCSMKEKRILVKIRREEREEARYRYESEMERRAERKFGC